MTDIYSRILAIKNSGKKAALCIVVRTKGSTPRKEGAKMIVFEDRQIEGSIGGGSIEKQTIDDAVEVIKKNKPKKFSYNLEQDLEMNCGGSIEVFIEPVNPDRKLYIFGAGHIGKALAKYAPDFGFAITLFDERNDIFGNIDLKGIKFIQKNYFLAIKETVFDNNTYIVIITHKHKYDEDILALCAKKPHAYVGMIGSKSKIIKAKQKFLDEQLLSEEEINNIDMPIGIKFQAETPEEIAISIIAKLIDVKNRM